MTFFGFLRPKKSGTTGTKVEQGVKTHENTENKG